MFNLSDRDWAQIKLLSNIMFAAVCIWIGVVTLTYISEIQELRGNCLQLIEPDVLCPIMCGNRSYNLTMTPGEVSDPTLNMSFMPYVPGEIWDYSRCRELKKGGFTPEEWIQCSRWFRPS